VGNEQRIGVRLPAGFGRREVRFGVVPGDDQDVDRSSHAPDRYRVGRVGPLGGDPVLAQRLDAVGIVAQYQQRPRSLGYGVDDRVTDRPTTQHQPGNHGRAIGHKS
jgi:hypothetical protein